MEYFVSWSTIIKVIIYTIFPMLILELWLIRRRFMKALGVKIKWKYVLPLDYATTIQVPSKILLGFKRTNLLGNNWELVNIKGEDYYVKTFEVFHEFTRWVSGRFGWIKRKRSTQS